MALAGSASTADGATQPKSTSAANAIFRKCVIKMSNKKKIEALRKRGPRTDCCKCLREFRLDNDITDDQWKRGICSKCWAAERASFSEQDKLRTEIGGKSSPASFENSDISGGIPITRHAGIIGLRNDVKWYKKSGSNGDG